MTAIIENVLLQHAENAASLWLQRHHAVTEPHYDFTDLMQLDDRVDANLEGLRLAGPAAHDLLDDMIRAGDGGSLFAKTVLLLESDQATDLEAWIDQVDAEGTLVDELEAAFAWVNPVFLRSTVAQFLQSEHPIGVTVALKACLAHGRIPTKQLPQLLRHPDTAIRCAALNCAAESGQRQLMAHSQSCATADSEQERLCCARALAFLGDQEHASALLEPIALSGSAFGSTATTLYALLHDTRAVRTLLRQLHALGGRDRDVIRGFGLLGDPSVIPWLIERTHDPLLSRLAGESIAMIWGVDLADADLDSSDVPEALVDGGVNDNPDDPNITLSEDDDLPWPDAERLEHWWSTIANPNPGTRLLAGRHRDATGLGSVLLGGMQRQRQSASIALALDTPDAAFLDTRLPCNKQTLWPCMQG